jgi:tryptophan-rich sensory protein
MKLSKMDFRNGLWLLSFLALCFCIAISGSIATQHSVGGWYVTLQKASWTPPTWVFPPVWSILYVMIAVSGWLVFISPKSLQRDRTLLIYFLQLGLNGAWSFLFFYFKSPILSLIDLSLLVVLIEATFRIAWPISKKAVYLLVPYFVWTLYALSLNGAIVYYLLK